MPTLTLHCDLRDSLAGIQELLGKDLPYTIARFLTMEAQSGQEAARASERTVFKLRNDWTVRNTKITPARKDTLFSEVYTDTSNRKSGAPDYLPIQDTGGTKVPAHHKHLALPTDYLYKYTSRGKPIPDQLRPTALLGPTRLDIGQHAKGTFTGGRSNGVHRAIGRETLKKLKTSEYIAFLQYAKSGTLCIFVRHGGFSWHGGTQDAEPWYVLIPRASIKPRFPMEQLVEAAVLENMDKNFDRAAAEVLVNNALRHGFQVRF